LLLLTLLLIAFGDLHYNHGYHHYQEAAAKTDEHTPDDVIDEKSNTHTEEKTTGYGDSRYTPLLVLFP
jgi:hypothetical protein